MGLEWFFDLNFMVDGRNDVLLEERTLGGFEAGRDWERAAITNNGKKAATATASPKRALFKQNFGVSAHGTWHSRCIFTRDSSA